MSAFEAWMLVLTALSVLVAAGVSIWAVFFGVRRSDIHDMRSQLNLKAEELVNAKFQVLAAEMESPVRILNRIVGDMEKRLQKGDEQFDEGGEKIHRIELQCTSLNSQTRTWALEHFATHGQLTGVADSLRDIETALARCEEQCKSLTRRVSERDQ